MVALSQISLKCGDLITWFLVAPGENFCAVLQDAELRKRFAEFGLEPLASALARLGEPMA